MIDTYSVEYSTVPVKFPASNRAITRFSQFSAPARPGPEKKGPPEDFTAGGRLHGGYISTPQRFTGSMMMRKAISNGAVPPSTMLPIPGLRPPSGNPSVHWTTPHGR